MLSYKISVTKFNLTSDFRIVFFFQLTVHALPQHFAPAPKLRWYLVLDWQLENRDLHMRRTFALRPPWELLGSQFTNSINNKAIAASFICKSKWVKGHYVFERICSLAHKELDEPPIQFVKYFNIIPRDPFLESPENFSDPKSRSKNSTLFCEAGLSICCEGNKNWNNCKVSCLEMPLFWRYKENYVTRKAPEKFREFRGTGSRSEEDHGKEFEISPYNSLFIIDNNHLYHYCAFSLIRGRNCKEVCAGTWKKAFPGYSS